MRLRLWLRRGGRWRFIFVVIAIDYRFGDRFRIGGAGILNSRLADLSLHAISEPCPADEVGDVFEHAAHKYRRLSCLR